MDAGVASFAAAIVRQARGSVTILAAVDRRDSGAVFRGSGQNRLAAILLGGIILGLAALATLPAAAAPLAQTTSTCFGRAATITSNKPLVSGTKHADVIVTGNNDNSVAAAEGNDRVCLGDGRDFARGDTGDDQISGGAGADLISGGSLDIKETGSGNDTILGGPGPDQLNGHDGNDVIKGGPGDDIIQGGPGHDVCVGGGGHDQITGCEA